MINIKDISNTNNYHTIDRVEYKKDKIIFYYKEKWNKNLKRLPFIRYGENNYILDLSACYHHIIIHCKEEDIINEINKHSFSTLASGYEHVKAQEAKARKKQKTKERKEYLLKILKPNNIVERYGKTPNLSLHYIQVEKVSDYGVSGFYLGHDNKRTNEYTTVAWDYVKGKVESITV